MANACTRCIDCSRRKTAALRRLSCSEWSQRHRERPLKKILNAKKVIWIDDGQVRSSAARKSLQHIFHFDVCSSVSVYLFSILFFSSFVRWSLQQRCERASERVSARSDCALLIIDVNHHHRRNSLSLPSTKQACVNICFEAVRNHERHRTF